MRVEIGATKGELVAFRGAEPLATRPFQEGEFLRALGLEFTVWKRGTGPKSLRKVGNAPVPLLSTRHSQRKPTAVRWRSRCIHSSGSIVARMSDRGGGTKFSVPDFEFIT